MSEGTPIPENQAESYPSEVEVLYGFDKIIHGAHIKSLDKMADDDGVVIWNIEAPLSDGRTIECVYKRSQHLAGEKLPSRIHSVIYGSATEGSVKGPEYHYINGEWQEVVLPPDTRGI